MTDGSEETRGAGATGVGEAGPAGTGGAGTGSLSGVAGGKATGAPTGDAGVGAKGDAPPPGTHGRIPRSAEATAADDDQPLAEQRIGGDGKGDPTRPLDRA